MYRKKTLIIIILFFLIKGLFLIFLIPPWEAPDEPAHVAYVMYLWNKMRIPTSISPFLPESISESISGNRILMGKIRMQDAPVKENRLSLFNPHDTVYTPDTITAASHPPLYYITLMPFFILSLTLQNSYLTLLMLRLGSLAYGMIGLYVTYRLGIIIFQNKPEIPLLAVFLLSLQPMYSFISSIVNIDAMSVTIYTLIIYMVMKSAVKKPLRMIPGFLMGIGTLVKPTLIVLPICYLFTAIRRKLSARDINLLAIPFLFPLLWFLWKLQTEGAQARLYGVQNIQTYPLSILSYPPEFFRGGQPAGIFMSFWGFFGWLDTPMPKWIYSLFMLFIITGLLGYAFICNKKYSIFRSIKSIIRHPESRLSRDREIFQPPVSCKIPPLPKLTGSVGMTQFNNAIISTSVFTISVNFVTLSTLLFILLIFLYDLYYFRLSHGFWIQGRYFAPVLPLILLFLLKGIYFFPERVRNILLGFFIAVFVVSNAVMIGTISLKYFGNVIPRFPLLSVYN